ncbi:chromate transporter [Bacillus shivajii]|uniref:chromate transporter n=1 Tax=Bacillus shivajii TaxID=1983719 RepID=UPI001CFB2F39|nr:chromate transporter [Bacillus shivajii]UCZ52488.1 chromate transporter [Bacillus shivajii]
MYFELFMMFFKIGAVSFGGGYAMLPIIETEVTNKGWFSTQEFTDIIAVAGMSPGPIATNSATVVGYHVGGVTGAITASIAMTLPSLMIILLLSSLILKVKNGNALNAVFYGLRPVVLGLICYAAIKFALANNLLALSFSFANFMTIAIFIVTLTGLIKYKLHPVLLIIASGIMGILLL